MGNQKYTRKRYKAFTDKKCSLTTSFGSEYIPSPFHPHPERVCVRFSPHNEDTGVISPYLAADVCVQLALMGVSSKIESVSANKAVFLFEGGVKVEVFCEGEESGWFCLKGRGRALHISATRMAQAAICSLSDGEGYIYQAPRFLSNPALWLNKVYGGKYDFLMALKFLFGKNMQIESLHPVPYSDASALAIGVRSIVDS